MTVVPSSASPTVEKSALSLARYCQIVGLDECGFWGLFYEGQPAYGCGSIWTKQTRDQLAQALKDAQDDIEAQIGYHLAPAWDVNEVQPYVTGRAITRFGRVISGGVKAVTNISLAAAVNHAADPAVIGPVATTVTDDGEIHVFYPGTDAEIIPSEITIAGGAVTIKIPRCRMVKSTLINNPDTGLDYSDVSNFQATVDIKRIYNDTTDQGELVAPLCDCDEDTAAACIYIRNSALGIIDVKNESGTCPTRCLCGCEYQFARLNYYSGDLEMSSRAETAIIRLAHSKLPETPCGCGPAAFAWKRDRTTPDVSTRERINCPFGLSEGSWFAWQFARNAALRRGGMI